MTKRLPLSREQEGLWVEWKLSPTGSSYNTCIQVALDGEIDPQRFNRAIATVVRENELLHCHLHDDGTGIAFIPSDEPYEIDVLDVSEGAQEESDAARQRAFAELNRRRDAAIDLTRFPLVRSALIRVARQRWYFIGVVPHIISDGYSALSIMREISAVYEADTDVPGASSPEGSTNLDAEPKVDWPDYLAELNATPQDRRQAAMDFWTQKLDGANHHCPIAPPPSSVADTAGRRHFFSVDSHVTKRLASLARAQRTSIFSALAALYGAFLHRETGQEDLVVAHSVDLRPRGYRDVFGFFVNVIPLRMQLAADLSFNELIHQVGQFRRQSKKHQQLPALDIVATRRATHSAFDGRLTNVSMGQTVSRFQGIELKGVTTTALDNDLIEVRDDLSFMYELGEDSLGIWLEYRQSGFSTARIEAMAGRFARLIDSLCEAPDHAIGECNLLPPDRQQELLTFAQGPVAPPVFTSFASWFQQRVAITPDAIAVATASQNDGHKRSWPALSYYALAQAALAQAHELPAGRAPIALKLSRSPAQLVAILACLLTGRPYVPLDPATPAARIQTILRDCGASCLLTDTTDDAGIGERSSCSVQAPYLQPESAHIVGDKLPNAGATESELAWPSLSSEDPTAYLIYTSGSTGQPKGVVVAQSAVMQRLSWLQQRVPLTVGTRTLANTSFAFDVSVAELLWPLGAGATLVLAPEQLARDFRSLGRLIEREAVELCLLVPSALGALLESNPTGDAAEAPDPLRSVRYWLAAGEALPVALVERFRQRSFTGSRLLNLYGPTEATIYATCSDPLDRPTDAPVTIGRPIGATEAYVLSPNLTLQDIDMEGELCVGGSALAMGYHGDPERTESQFVPNPFGEGRLYRTGDRARWLANGEIEYLGRADGQIKLRGYRIELGEIEQTLVAYPSVGEAAVRAIDTGTTGSVSTQLVAYYTAASEASDVPVEALKAFLEQSLPGYMVPVRYLRLETIPRLASGKVNSQALPQPDQGASAPFVAPQTADERAFARAIASTLNIAESEVGIDSNFFELGGDSLLLIGLETELAQAGLFIEVQTLFAEPTIRSALPFVSHERLDAVSQREQSGTFPALARHRKLFEDGFVRPEHWNRCILVRFQRHLDLSALEQAMAAVQQHHDGLRLSFHGEPSALTFHMHAAEQMPVALEHHSLAGIADDQRPAALKDILNGLNAGFSLSAPPLIRLAVIDEETHSTAAIVSHHLLIDMRSAQILMEDLLSAYQARLGGRTPRLPEKTTSVGDWSSYLSEKVAPSITEEEQRYWLDQLADTDQPLPGQPPHAQAAADPSVQGSEQDQTHRSRALSPAHTEQMVREVTKTLDAGVHELLLSAFAQAYREVLGAESLTVNTCGIGRQGGPAGLALGRTVGELNTVYPLRLAVADPNPLASVREAVRTVPAEGLHYGLLRYLLRDPEICSRPEPAVFFNYVSRIDSALGRAVGAELLPAPAGVYSSAPENRACYGLYVEGSIRAGQLRLELGYSRWRFADAQGEALLEAWYRATEALIKTEPAG